MSVFGVLLYIFVSGYLLVASLSLSVSQYIDRVTVRVLFALSLLSNRAVSVVLALLSQS